MIGWLATLPVFLMFNRIRGGGMSGITDHLPGRALYYVGGTFGALSAVFFGPMFGLAVALGFIIWGAPGWGLWFDLHRNDAADKDDPRRSDWFVRIVDLISFTSDHVALFWRHFWLVLPFLGASAYLAGSPLVMALSMPFSVLVVAGYEYGHRAAPSKAITIGELIAGALWWALILIIGTLL